ncbi:MAG: stage II sporulation protein M [Treponema sp.]|nr:stage II sporulation protein M [Treponema sp.]
MTQQIFINRRRIFWDDFEKMIRSGKAGIKAQAAMFPKSYRELTQDLNTARAHGFDPSIIERLNTLVLEGNQLLYSNRSFSLRPAADFLLRTFPRAVRSGWRSLGIAVLIFYGISFFIFFMCVRFPDAAYEIIGENQAWDLEQMYNPDSSYYLNPRNVSSDADMFGFYIYNNISLAFQTFAGGILAGFGSLVILCSNAVFLGAAAGHIFNRGFGSTFFAFIIAHSAFELTAIIFSAQAGLLLGYRLFFTRGLTRAASLKEAGKTALPLVAGAAIMLFIAACIEAFWSSRHEFPAALRFGSGIFCWAFVLFYFIFAGRRR